MLPPHRQAVEAEVAISLSLEPSGLVRRAEPVCCGIPLPQGLVNDTDQLSLTSPKGIDHPVQPRALDRWPDGSIRWVLLTWFADAIDNSHYTLKIGDRPVLRPCPSQPASVFQNNDGLQIDTGRARFSVSTGNRFPFASVFIGSDSAIDAERSTFVLESSEGRHYAPEIKRCEIIDSGPLSVIVKLTGDWRANSEEAFANLEAFLHFFSASATVRFSITIQNPRRATHPDGIWELGDPGSIFMRDASFRIVLPAGHRAGGVRCSVENGSPFETLPIPMEIHQESSGGENWRSANHVNRHGEIPLAFRGYHLKTAHESRSGLRATPLIGLETGQNALAIAMQYFWQDFPKAIEADTESLTLRLFPRQSLDVHELQGGEQKTHHFYVAFAKDNITDEPLAWCRQPLIPRADPAWYCSTGALQYLTPKNEDPNLDYLALVEEAIDGDATFDHKREVIDEYGWRHFGEIYGDHEAVQDPTPSSFVSHYNNQYDAIAGFAYQFLRSGDLRWWRQMNELAWHVLDIDLYHTDRDRPLYNRGLFWHTVHYTHAGSATHRSYPNAPGVHGGGPSGEHNYTTGLMLHYFLTGNERSRRAVIDLAQWVIDMDDGRKTPFALLCLGDTGWSSASDSPTYHGPGRGSANSLNALLDGHRLTGDMDFSRKAQQLIRRCIHPVDDISLRHLEDVERRWFYTMFLQSLGKYLDYKTELGERDFIYTYAQSSLLHYARWMVEHEYPYLEKPEILEFPTETWAAQEMRKCEAFLFAAKYASEPERLRFLERARFFFNYSTTTLRSMPTHTLCRPTVLMLAHGWMYAWFRNFDDVSAPALRSADFGKPENFVPQKIRAFRRAAILAGAASILTLSAIGYVALRWVKQ